MSVSCLSFQHSILPSKNAFCPFLERLGFIFSFLGSLHTPAKLV
jgi:hypothetical protein